MSKFTFKGVDLSPFLNILEIKRTIGNERILTTEDLVETGVDLQEVSYGAKVIKIKVALASRAMQSQTFVDTIEYPEIENTNLNTLREHVAMLLSAKEPYKLELPDEPNRFYLAIPKGDIELEGISDWYDQTTIDFFIPDGVAHTNVTKEFTFTKNSEGILEAEIDNQGNEEVSVNYRIKLKHESGYIGIVSQYGAMQFGKIEETDLVEEKKNVLLAANGKGDFKNWTDGTIFYENQNKKVVTKMAADSNLGGRLGVLPANFTNTANGAYFGAVKELQLSQQAKDWYIWARAWFETGYVSQTGAWCLSVVDSDNHFIAGMAIEKSERTRNKALVIFLMGDGAGGSRVVKSIEFTPSLWVRDNPYSLEGKDQNRNMFDLRKEGDKVTFFWYGGYHHYFESKLKDKQAVKVQFFVGQYKGGNSTINQLVTHHYLNDFSFYKLNVPFWRDVPNRYPTGAELFIDSTGEVNPEEKGRLYVNNLLAPDDEILGTDYFKVPPGKTKVQLLVSSFAEVESARAEIEEAWI